MSRVINLSVEETVRKSVSLVVGRDISEEMASLITKIRGDVHPESDMFLVLDAALGPDVMESLGFSIIDISEETIQI